MVNTRIQWFLRTEPPIPSPWSWLPGLAVAAAAATLAWIINLSASAIPLLTAAVAIGIVVAQFPRSARLLSGPMLAPGISMVSRRFMRVGIVLLGLKLSLTDIAALGLVPILLVATIVVLTFVATLLLGRLARLPGHQPLLIATGFSICGASAIGAMSGAVKAKDEETAVPIALVTLCGTLAIAVLPLLWQPLGLTAQQFGHWAGASIHDVGQVVATAQVAGATGLAVAVVIKLTRVAMLAPMVAIAAILVRHRSSTTTSDTLASAKPHGGAPTPSEGSEKRPPVLPLFVVGFLGAVVLRTLMPLPDIALHVADAAQTACLAVALFGLGTAVRLREIFGTGWRALVVGLAAWLVIAALALAVVIIG